MQACLNCGQLPTGRFCQFCGQRVGARTLTVRALLAQIPQVVFDVDRGLGPTLLGLLRRPGDVINGYLDGRRVRYTNPLVLVLLFTGFNAALFSSGWLNFSRLVVERGELPREGVEVMQKIFQYAALLLVVQLPVAGAITRMCFAASGRNYAEHLVINTYVAAMGSAYMVLLFPVLWLLNDTPWFGLAWNSALPVFLLYSGFVFIKVFGTALGRGASVRRTLGALALYVLSNILMYGVPMGIFLYRLALRDAGGGV